MRSARFAWSLSVFLSLFGMAADARTPTVASDGTVSGTLTLDGTKFALTHIYARKREAWPADVEFLSAKELENLPCGIVDVIMTNEPLTEPEIAAILQGDYRGSPKTRGVRLVIDGAGTYKWETLFLLDTGTVQAFGTTQTEGSIAAGARYSGKLAERNEDVTKVRVVEVTFDTAVKVQYARTEAEKAEPIAGERIAEEFVKTLPGEWNIERWLGISCVTASGTLAITERTNPHTFKGTFHIKTSKGNDIDEEATISINGGKVHIEGGSVSVPEKIWTRDVFDLDFYRDLMIGNNDTDFVVLRKLGAKAKISS